MLYIIMVLTPSNVSCMGRNNIYSVCRTMNFWVIPRCEREKNRSIGKKLDTGGVLSSTLSEKELNLPCSGKR